MKTSRKCHQCGLVNLATDTTCRRCRVSFGTLEQVTEPGRRISASTIYLCLFVLAAVGFGAWVYWYKKGTDRDLKAKAEWAERQMGNAGHDLSSPPEGAPTPTLQNNRVGETNVQALMEQLKKREEERRAFREQALKASRPPE